MKKLLPPKISEIISIESFREKNQNEINAVTSMLSKRGKDLFIQASLADELRYVQVGNEVTFVINQNINFTNHCMGSCRFCSYRYKPNDKTTTPFRMKLDDIRIEVEKALARGATEVCVQGGLDPEIDYDFYFQIIRTIRKVSSSLHIHGFSPAEIAYMSQLSGENVEDIFKELKIKGLNSFPGTAAEILVDDIRKIICPEKLSTHQWVNIVTIGHKLGLNSTSTMMYGHIESLQDQAEHFVILKKIQEETKGFTEFVPLPFIHHNTVLYRHLGARPGSTGMHDFAVLSAARLYLGDILSNIQVSWPKLGPKFAQLSLNAGVNDLGGTLFVENISKSAGAKYGEQLDAEEFLAIIHDSNRLPVQRDTLYNKLKVFNI